MKAQTLFIIVSIGVILTAVGSTIYTGIVTHHVIEVIKSHPLVELPEEHMEISKDSVFQTPMSAYYRGDTLVLSFLNQLGEYQIELEMDSVTLYEYDRFIGTVPHGNSPLDSLILSDNL